MPAETTVAPTPSKPFISSEATKNAPPPRNDPKLAAALSQYAEGGTRGNTKTPPAPVEPAEPPATPKTDDKPAPHVKFIASDDVPPAAPVASETPAASTDPSPEVVKSAPAQLREAYERSKAERDQLKSEFASAAAERDLTKKELAEFRAKLKEQEDKVKATEAEAARAKELEAKYLATDERLRITDYLNHSEFHERYVKPVADAIAASRELIAQLVVDPDGEPRQATDADFNTVLSASNLTEATRRAKELFGSDLAPQVVAQRENVIRAQRNRAKAIEESGARAVEWHKQQQNLEAAKRNEVRTKFQQVADELAAKVPSYRPPDGDKEALEARKSGEAIAQVILNPEGVPQEEYYQRYAKVYHRAASFPMLELRMQRLEKERDALAQRLADYEKSTPDAQGRKESSGSVASAPGKDDLRAKLRSDLMKYAR